MEEGPIFAGAEKAFKRCKAIVAIPARDEQDHIEDCLTAIGSQRGDIPYGIVLVLNNCTDETPAIAGHLAHNLRIPVRVINVEFSPKRANSAHARRLAMQEAAALAGAGTVLLTTDADGQVPSNWLQANITIIEKGIEAVAGRSEIDPSDARKIPASLHEDDARECYYARLIDGIHALLDPDPNDPWPRHSEHSGASLAVTLAAYRRAGGIPLVSPGEDRALVEALKRTDARVRHAPEVSVVVSGRIFGRAAGGMADTIRRRLVKPDAFLDDQLEPAVNAVRRARLCRLFRTVKKRPSPQLVRIFAECVSLKESMVKQALSARFFGAAWAEIERCSAALLRHRVFTGDLRGQTDKALSILRALRGPAFFKRQSTHSIDSAVTDASLPACSMVGSRRGTKKSFKVVTQPCIEAPRSPDGAGFAHDRHSRMKRNGLGHL